MSETSESAVLEWLRKEGYPLEVQVGKTCRAKGWLTYHSFPYSDASEQKVRECDVYATRFARHHGAGTLSIDLAIECKRSLGKPWVVFGESSRPHDWIVPSMLAPGRVPDAVFMFLAGRTPDPLDFLRPVDWVGFNVVKAHTTSKDGDPSGAHSALRATMNAAEAFAARNERQFAVHPDWPPHPSVILPILVVDAPLYRYSIADNATETLTAIDVAKVTAPQRHFEARTLITIVTASGFPSWLDQVTAWADPILTELAPKSGLIPKMVEDARRVEDML